jgi:hypothetical protein
VPAIPTIQSRIGEGSALARHEIHADGRDAGDDTATTAARILPPSDWPAWRPGRSWDRALTKCSQPAAGSPSPPDVTGARQTMKQTVEHRKRIVIIQP